MRLAFAAEGGIPDGADVLAALRDIKFEGVAYAAPEAFRAKGGNTGALIL